MFGTISDSVLSLRQFVAPCDSSSDDLPWELDYQRAYQSNQTSYRTIIKRDLDRIFGFAGV